ncbi:Uncharacterized protein APZ42_009038 [Daphnia magna]|uniref:Uncharacterized protein n=1 Tax=Daphnia magna TaxID=35525 RepID=A0A164E946_9CRUS|nr:Uncharacterized protein APZ42_009038 [Daphnia magna]
MYQLSTPKEKMMLQEVVMKLVVTMEIAVAIGRRKHLDFFEEKKVLFFLLHYS